MPKVCTACGDTALSQVASWADWVTACGKRADGPMRLAAAELCGVAAAQPALMQCAQCRSVSMDPIPDNDQLAAFYTNYHATDDFVAKADKKVARAFKRLLPLRVMSGGGRFLEVGASIGTAAEAARRLGFEAVAQEVDGDAVAKGRNLFPLIDFVEGFIEDVDVAEPFAVIYCAEVIEHVPDPLDFTKQLYARLQPGGWLFLTTPDAGHKKRPPSLMDWKSVKPPEHITLFTQAGLKALFLKAGFDMPRFFPYAKPGIRMLVRRAQ